VPQDTLGFSEIIVEDLKAAKVDASNLGALMDDHGTVEVCPYSTLPVNHPDSVSLQVTRNPPDEEWTGGHDR
jgi:calcium permeable stress-gated cation channel